MTLLLRSLFGAFIVNVIPTLIMIVVAYRSKVTAARLDLMTAFAAGALITDAGHHLGDGCSPQHVVISIALFFIIDIALSSNSLEGEGWLAIIGDAVHNFTDGLALSASTKHQYSTIVAITVHEIPHQLADLAVLLKSGFTVRDILRTQLATSLACYLGVLIGHYTKRVKPEQLEGFTAGAFLYLSMSTLLPSVKRTPSKGKKLKKENLKIIVAFIVGIIIISLLD